MLKIPRLNVCCPLGKTQLSHPWSIQVMRFTDGKTKGNHSNKLYNTIRLQNCLCEYPPLSPSQLFQGMPPLQISLLLFALHPDQGVFFFALPHCVICLWQTNKAFSYILNTRMSVPSPGDFQTPRSFFNQINKLQKP